MGNARFRDGFKRGAVHPLSDSGLTANHEKKITVRGYPVSEISKRLGVSTYSLYIWVKKYFKSSGVSVSDEQAAENMRLKRELARGAEERDILKNDLDLIADRVNTRPRKTLCFKTPAYRLTEMLR